MAIWAPYTVFHRIKIRDRANIHKSDPKITLITWRKKGNKYSEINFGYRTKCDALGKMFLEIPLECLFFGSQKQLPHNLQQHKSILIDLFELRQIVKNTVISYHKDR